MQKWGCPLPTDIPEEPNNVLPNLESIEVEPTNLLDRIKSALPMDDQSDNNAAPESVAEESVAETTDPQPAEESSASLEKQSESESPCIVAPQKPIEAAINAATTDARPKNSGKPDSAEATAPKSDSASAQPDNGTLFPDIENPKSEEPPSLPKTKTAVSKPRTTVKTSDKTSRAKKTDAVKKTAKPGMSSSPLPTQAYSSRTDLTESDKNRTAEDAVIWSELKALGCNLIDKRGNGGALWVVPPEGKESIVKKTLFSLKKRFNIVYQWSPKGGRATKHTPAWFITISRRC